MIPSYRNRDNSPASQDELDAIARVEAAPELAKYKEILFAPHFAWDDRMDWIAHAPLVELVNWCEYRAGLTKVAPL